MFTYKESMPIGTKGFTGLIHETSAQGSCTRMTQRDGMGREVGGGSGWGHM